MFDSVLAARLVTKHLFMGSEGVPPSDWALDVCRRRTLLAQQTASPIVALIRFFLMASADFLRTRRREWFRISTSVMRCH